MGSLDMLIVKEALTSEWNSLGSKEGWIAVVLAEAVGFEPTVGFPLRSVSNRVLSASQPRFRRGSFNRAGGRGQEGKRCRALGILQQIQPIWRKARGVPPPEIRPKIKNWLN